MNSKILNKILEELNKAEPDLSYAKGILETLIAFGPQEPVIMLNTDMGKPIPHPSGEADESSTLDAMAKARLQTVKDLAKQSEH